MCNIKNLHITAHIYERKRNNIGLGKIEKMKFAFLFFFPCDSPLKNTYTNIFQKFLGQYFQNSNINLILGVNISTK